MNVVWNVWSRHVGPKITLLPVHNIDHALGVRVTIVRVMRRALVDHGLVNGVCGLVGENAGRQAGNDLLDLYIVDDLQSNVSFCQLRKAA